MRVSSQLRAYSTLLLAGLMFLFYIWLASRIPYTFDDWLWGSDLGLRYLVTAAQNSRYAGNLVVITLTRSRALKTLVMAAVFTASPYCLSSFTVRCLNMSSNQPLKAALFLGANLLTFLMPVSVWAQTCGWVSGFANYAVSGLLLILYLQLILRLEGESPEPVAFRLGVFLFGVVMQLFLENLAMYFLLVSLSLVLVRALRKQPIKKSLLFLLAGNVLGFLILFSSDIYPIFWRTGMIGDYRKIMFDKDAPLPTIILQLAGRFYYDILPALIEYSGLLPSFTLGAMLLNAIPRFRAEKRQRFGALMLGAFHLLFAAYFLYRYMVMRYGMRISQIERLEELSESLPYLFYLLLVTLDLFLLFREKKELFRWLTGIWVSPVLIIAPMAGINTVFPRSFLTSNLCYELLLMLLLALVWDTWKKPLQWGVLVALSAGVLVCAWHFGHVYYDIGLIELERERVIYEAKSENRSSVHIPYFPHDQYVYIPFASRGFYQARYREFYGLPEDVELYFEQAPSE